MMPAPQRQTAAVGERRHIMRMGAIQRKADGGAAVRLPSNQVQSGNFRQPFQGVGGETGIVFEDCVPPNPHEILDCGGQANRASDVGRPGFKPVRWLFEAALFQSHARDHFAAAMPWRKRLENLGSSVQAADAGRSRHFVSGKSGEIATEIANVYRQVAGTLGEVDEGDGSDSARTAAQLGDRVDRA